MVHPVMGRCVEHRLKPGRQLPHGLGMDPELIEQIHADHRHDHQRIKAQQRQPQPEQHFVDSLTHTLAQSGPQIEVLR